MERITVVGWRPGLDKIALNRLLRDECGYSLGDAKKVVDKILENQEIDLAVQDSASILHRLEELGVACKSRQD